MNGLISLAVCLFMAGSTTASVEQVHSTAASLQTSVSANPPTIKEVPAENTFPSLVVCNFKKGTPVTFKTARKDFVAKLMSLDVKRDNCSDFTKHCDIAMDLSQPDIPSDGHTVSLTFGIKFQDSAPGGQKTRTYSYDSPDGLKAAIQRIGGSYDEVQCDLTK